jgi:hypothetical protein
MLTLGRGSGTKRTLHPRARVVPITFKRTNPITCVPPFISGAVIQAGPISFSPMALSTSFRTRRTTFSRLLRHALAARQRAFQNNATETAFRGHFNPSACCVPPVRPARSQTASYAPPGLAISQERESALSYTLAVGVMARYATGVVILRESTRQTV